MSCSSFALSAAGGSPSVTLVAICTTGCFCAFKVPPKNAMYIRCRNLHHPLCNGFCAHSLAHTSQTYSYKTCGFQQLDKSLCECYTQKSPKLCVLPACSHAFGTACMKANIWRSEPSQLPTHRTIRCPLCDKPNAVNANLLLLVCPTLMNGAYNCNAAKGGISGVRR